MGNNVLVLNHTRMGDLIQTTPLIRGLKEENPDARITLLVNAKFAGIVEFIDGVDELVMLDIHQFTGTSTQEPDVLKIYEYLDQLSAGLKARGFDTIINLSHSKLSAMLSWLIGARDTRGFLSNARGELLIQDPWLVYFTSFLGFRKYNRFNIVDLYTRGAGITSKNNQLSLTVGAKDIKAVEARKKEMGIKEGEIIIGIQAGASRSDRRWPPENFAKVADHLAVNRGAKIALFGAESEKDLGDEVEEAMETDAINLIGATSLNELVTWIKSIDLLITNDTGTMHIAAAVGTPIVAIFFTHARCEETGPYCDGAFILQADIDCAPCSHQTVCDHYSCLEYITPADVIAGSETLLDRKNHLPEDSGLFANAKPYFSRFHGDGGIEYVPAVKEPLDSFEFFAYLYRPIFNEVIDNWQSPMKISLLPQIVEEAVLDLEKRFLWPPKSELERWIERAKDGALRLIDFAKEDIRLTGMLDPSSIAPGRDVQKETTRKITSLHDDLRVLSETHNAVSPLIAVYRRRVENFEEDDALMLIDEAKTASLWLHNSARLFMISIDHVYKRIITNGQDQGNTAQAIGDKM